MCAVLCCVACISAGHGAIVYMGYMYIVGGYKVDESATLLSLPIQSLLANNTGAWGFVSARGWC